AASQLTTDRSVRRRVFPWGRRSPLRSKELSNYLAGSRTAVALSKLHKSDLSVCAPRRRSLCARLPSLDVVDRCVDRKPAAPGSNTDESGWSPSRPPENESATCPAGHRA